MRIFYKYFLHGNIFFQEIKKYFSIYFTRYTANQQKYSIIIIIFTIFHKFRFNNIGDQGAAALGESLAKLQNLTNLNLGLW